MTQTINFTLDFNGSSYDLNGDLKTQKITAETDGDIVTKDNSFTMDIRRFISYRSNYAKF